MKAQIALTGALIGASALLAACTPPTDPGGPTTTASTVPSATPATFRVSEAPDGTAGNSASTAPALSADGRFVAFVSGASNLVPGDTNNRDDTFVYDHLTGTTELVSVTSEGMQGNLPADGSLSISADGRFVAFVTGSRLAPGASGVVDVYVRDRTARTTERVSVASGGAAANSHSSEPSISADGRYVAFESIATNLIAGGDVNGTGPNVFVHDRQTRATEHVSVATDGTQGGGAEPSISADGRYVAFGSFASNLVPGDTNKSNDIFVHDRQTRATERVSVASNGTQGDRGHHSPSISANGRFVGFEANSTNLVPSDTNALYDIFVHDRQTRATERVSVATDGTQGSGVGRPALSSDGRYVAFWAASQFVPGAGTSGQVYVRDRSSGVTTLASASTEGAPSNHSHSAYAGRPSMSANGRFVAFASNAVNLVPGDNNNGSVDVFLRDRGA